MNSQNVVVDIGIEKSEPIHYVQGEKGRGITFDIINSLLPDEPVDISGYVATIHILKSDGNFTIERMSIDSEHAKAYYTLTENDCAVGGNGIFDISFSKNNELIYTSHGLYCGDNRAVNDDVVDSVSVAYGVTFPEGFQEKLTAGTNITITSDNVISASGKEYQAGDGIDIDDTIISLANSIFNRLDGFDNSIEGLSDDIDSLQDDLDDLDNEKQDVLTAGTGISILDNVISAITPENIIVQDLPAPNGTTKRTILYPDERTPKIIFLYGLNGSPDTGWNGYIYLFVGAPFSCGVMNNVFPYNTIYSNCQTINYIAGGLEMTGYNIGNVFNNIGSTGKIMFIY